VIIAPHADGLGDNLLYSTLPRLYAERGTEVLVSQRPGCRNREIQNLVWEQNPYVKGFTPHIATVPDGIDSEGAMTNAIIAEAKRYKSPVTAVERLHGFTTSGQYPEVHYKPTLREEWASKVVCDPSSMSIHLTEGRFTRFIDWCCSWYGLHQSSIVVVKSQFSGAGTSRLPGNARYRVSGIHEYADIILSCKMFLCIHSGGAALASALLRDDAEKVVVVTDEISFDSKCFTFPNLRFFV